MNTMKTNPFNILHTALRASVCLLMLTPATAAVAQDEVDGEAVEQVEKKPVKKVVLPTYEMKEVTGKVYDAATKAPMPAVRVQALDNPYYTALTEDDGSYTIKVPTFVTSLYITAPEYNGLQLGLVKGNVAPDAYLHSDKLVGGYQDGTELLHRSSTALDNTSAATAENEMENHLNASVRTISRGGIPSQGAAMFIQGINSININAQPLVIIDGVIWDMQYDRTSLHEGFYNNLLSLLDTEDIEDIQVLTNGTALYGSEGANGVILINTKRGKSMATRINARIYGGFEQKPELMSMMNAQQYRNYVTEFLGTTSAAQNLSGMSSNVAFMNPSSFYYPQYNNNTDWQKDLYRNSFTQNYRVNVQGGDDVAMYNLSLGYTKSDATIKNNDFNRLNIRFNTDINMFRNFDAGLDMAYVRSAYNILDNGWAESYEQQNVSSPNVLGLVQSPFLSKYTWYTTYDEATQQLYLRETQKILGGKDFNQSNSPFLFAKQFGYEGLANPYWILQNGEGENKNFMEQTQFSVNVAPRYKVNRFLTISDRFSYQIFRFNERLYMPTNGTPAKEVEGLGTVQSVLKSQFSKETLVFNDFRVDWKRNFGKHTVNLFGGFRLGSYSFSNSYISSYNNDNDKMPNMSSSQQYKSNGGANDRWLNLTYYLNADYNFLNRYFVKAILSAESSSRFGKEATGGVKLCGVPWGLFPSIQLGWVMSNEEWFDVKGIDYLKLNAGWEMSGNDNIDYYAARTYFANVKYLDKLTGLELANIENAAIQWETTYRWSAGLDLRMLNNRLNLGVRYFNNRTTDLLTRKSVSYITGLEYMWANDGELRNRGVEVSANAVLLEKKNWKWQAGLSVGHYQNEITALADNHLNQIEVYAYDANGIDKSQKTVINGYITNIYGANVLTSVGQSAGVFYGYKTAGVFSSDAEASAAGKYGYLRYPTGLAEEGKSSRNFQAGDVHFIDQNGDGWISEADMVVIGNPNPDIYGNFWTNLTWKHLTLDLNFKYSLGNDVFNYQRMQLESGNNIWNQTTALCNRWKADGQKTDIPRTMSATSDYWVNNERFSDRWVEDGSYLKLKKVRLTYQIPLNLSWLLGLNVWAEANNVFTISKYLGQDPEVSCSNSVLYQGIDAGMHPSYRNFNLGVTINL